MSHQALARKWRPQRFEQVVGQQHVLAGLVNALDQQRLHHAYLFSGTRGVGKTTIARIFAKSLNCEQGVSSQPCGVCSNCVSIDQGNFVDLLEIDAASRTKVEDTRELLDNVQYSPARGRYKVYLIDEVHMLSRHSFNALLKTLEEPPEHVKFLLATTDPQKLPITVLSRCLQFQLKALSQDDIANQLNHVLTQEGLGFEAEALPLLAKAADGSMRDALSLCDQALVQSSGSLSRDNCLALLGQQDPILLTELLIAVVEGDASAALAQVDQLAELAPDFDSLHQQLAEQLHQLALAKVLPERCDDSLVALAQVVDAQLVQLLYQIATTGRRDLAYAPSQRSGFEMTVLRMLAFEPALNEQGQGDAQSSGQQPVAGSSAAGVMGESASAESPRQHLQALKQKLAGAKNAKPADQTKPVERPAASSSAQQASTPQAESVIATASQAKTGANEAAPAASESVQDASPEQANSPELIDSPEQAALVASAVKEQQEIVEQAQQQGFVETPVSAAKPTTASQVSDEPATASQTSTDIPSVAAPQTADNQPAQMPSEPAQPAADNSDDYYSAMAQQAAAMEQEVEAEHYEPQGASPSLDASHTQSLIKLRSQLRAKEGGEKKPEGAAVDAADLAQRAARAATLDFSAPPEGGEPASARAADNSAPQLHTSAVEQGSAALDSQELTPAQQFVAQRNKPAQAAQDVQAQRPVEQVSEDLDQWAVWVEQMHLGPIARQIARHSLSRVEGNVVQLLLKPDCAHLQKPSSLSELTQQLSQLHGKAMELAITIGEDASQRTPAEQRHALHLKRLDHAKQRLLDDPNIQFMQQRMGAELNGDSVNYTT
ncbi:DNA polymerase III subunit gamma/tau [Aliagarivorans marinus]|uniref:DNA polymerase III subunit gamma/tau n=1 Tax=Aliagarivorans marinus TaxID=561965 RepID=UPI000429BBAD|nr:DNA polymerase III subunit gamma/tau [Aliagarivorans marinus]